MRHQPRPILLYPFLRMTTLILFLAIAGIVSAQPRIDQEQVNVDETVGGVAIGGGSDEKLAQVITAGADGFLRHVTIPIACDASSQLTVSIQTVAGGLPTGTVLASETLPGDLFPSTPPSPDSAFRIIEFAFPTRVRAGDEVAIVMEAIYPGCGIYSSPGGDSYAGGRAYFDARPNPPGWIPIQFSPNDPDDLPFQVFVDKTPGAGCRKAKGRR